MATESIKDFLNREIEQEEKELYEILKQFSNGIEEVVNYGTVIFKWCNDSLIGKNDQNVPVLLLFRHSLELCDAISILVKQSSIDPCKTHLRAQLESLLNSLFLFEKDQEKRAYAFLVCRAHQKIKLFKSFKADTQIGKQFKGKLKNSVLKDVTLPEHFDLNEMINAQRKLLKKNGYKEANHEYHRLKKTKRSPNWYEFYDGPPNLEQMAIRLGKVAEYETFYRHWSDYIHSTDIITGNLHSEEEQTYIAALRQPFDAQFITSTILTFSFELYRKMIDYFVPNNITHYRVWYLENMREFYAKVSNQKRIIKRSSE